MPGTAPPAEAALARVALVAETGLPRAARLLGATGLDVPPEFNGRDYAIFLLQVAAEIEHSLLAQYLFAAYSLGGPDVPRERFTDVRAWQETILGIAKEEMGHLITVQNVLTVLGAARHFQRDDYPNSNPLYPFSFRLEPLGLDSLAAYICAESPAKWDDEEAREIKARAQAEVGAPVNRVGALYTQLIALLKDFTTVPDSAFQPATVAFQPTWDEWGRGYREGQRGAEAMRVLDLPAPELLILPVDSRTAVVTALQEIAKQGEGLDLPPDENGSHFQRFLTVYRGLKQLGDDVRPVVRPLATNPTAGSVEGGDPADRDSTTPITHPEAVLWAHLFNVRYRKLLVNLSHAFELADDPTDRTTLTPRGALIHHIFSEMYNLRALSGLLVRLPVSTDRPDGHRAGPPFQMPYSLTLPSMEADRWRLHRDLLDAAERLITQLQGVTAAGDGQDYLTALQQWDQIERGHVEQLIAAPVAAGTTRGGPTS
ncbi:MAG: ferritin-like domain-containing protein [Mycobacterium leprae]